MEKVNQLEQEFGRFSDLELKNKTQEFRARLNPSAGGDEILDDLLPEAFAAVREASKRTLGLRHFDVQILGGIAMHQGKIAEMKTGEGKTLAATLAVYLNALMGKGVHVVTVNDYLSKRDTNWMGAVYHMLDVSVGCIVHDRAYLYEPKSAPDKNETTIEIENLKEVSRQEAYAADITYGTNNEFGFDYLRDNMVAHFSQMVQGKHCYAIVDECDSILIDEARTPLIISAPDAESTKLYETFSKIIPRLSENVDYNIDEKMRAVTLTDEGIEKVEKILGLDIYKEGGARYAHQLEQALRANVLFRKDKDYVVKNDEIIIVDDFTGRLMFGRRYSGGLHQAIEAKEGVRVQQESRTLATITFQNYFRMYKKLAGMTGTALTNAEEFSKVYKLEVAIIPTNKTMIRRDLPDRIYRTERGKFSAVISEIKERNKKGQPVLVGTVSIEKNELLSALLQKEGIEHNVLNAKNHEKEAQIIAEAGKKGAVTVATNMAGRGVDIILGGKPPAELKTQNSKLKTDVIWQKEHDEVISLGGLCVIGTERHEARRIDNQLRGRAGRQGDPGETQFFVSLEDDLMRVFGGDRIKRMMEMFNLPEDQPIENKMVSRALEAAQAKIEGFNFDIRKHVLEYDDVMNKQRERVYRMRREILDRNSEREFALSGGADFRPLLQEQILEMIRKEIKKFVEFHAQDNYADNWNYKEIGEIANAMFGLSEEEKNELEKFDGKEKLIGYLEKLAEEKYKERENKFGAENMREIEKAVMLRVIDMFWMEHLENMEHLRDSVRLRAYGQRDPLVEYKNEGHRMFRQLLSDINVQIVNMVFKVEINSTTANRLPTSAGATTLVGSKAAQKNESLKKQVGRNEPCPCGAAHSDGRPKKYKHCCGK
jgi:preprotein translocase subunit SecA